MSRSLQKLFAASFFVLLAACGGGNDSPSSTTGNLTSTGNTGATDNNPESDGGGGSPNSGTGSSGNSTGSPPPSDGTSDGNNSGPTTPVLAASVTQAPEDGARYLSGIVRLEVRGSGMRNVELLPAEGYIPRLATFNVSEDGASAYLDLDTKLIPNGGIKLRISAFDKPAGTTGAIEVVAMPTRTWLINNPEQPLGTPEARAISCLGMGYPYTSLTDAEPVQCIRWTLPSPPIPPEQCTTGLDVAYVRPGDSRAVFRNGSLVPASFSCLPEENGGHIPDACVCHS